MRENARRARDFAAFSKERFLAAPPAKRREIARALAYAWVLYGLDKRIETQIAPVLAEFAAFGRRRRAALEPRRRRSRSTKQALPKRALVSGGPDRDLNEPSAPGAPIRKAKRLPGSLAEALKGPLFPDLGFAGIEERA